MSCERYIAVRDRTMYRHYVELIHIYEVVNSKLRGAGSVFKLGGGGQGQDSMACNYLQLIEYEKLIVYLSPGAPRAAKP